MRIKVRKIYIFATIASILGMSCRDTSHGQNYALIPAGASENEIIGLAANLTPADNQFTWQKLEFTAFLHFTINTFTGKEWGEGTEDPVLFNPTQLDARQWARVCSDAGMKMIVVTAKHHDGFCLWPSNYTDHSVKSSPWKNGQGDVVGEVADACRANGLKFGVYLSPWDRHETTYGSKAYDDYFVNQLTELLTRYGQVDEVWFDGAAGKGNNGKFHVFDWKRYYATIRKHQPRAVIAIMGPDVRWVGTESGYGRVTEWSVVSAAQQHQGLIMEKSQSEVNLPPVQDMTNDDLGSREIIKNAQMLVWYPSEVDVSIRPGWFYHAGEDTRVKTPEKLVDIYYSSIGRNSLLLLNLPPDRRGLLHENDIKSLQGMRQILNQTFNKNLAEGARISVSSSAAGSNASALLDDDYSTCWIAARDQSSAQIDLLFDHAIMFDRLLLQENIRIGQRIELFRLEALLDSAFKTVTEGTTVGYKRLLRFDPVTTSAVRLSIVQSRTNPTLSSFGLYKAPPEVIVEPAGGVFVDSLQFQLRSSDPGAILFYTLDGSDPTVDSYRYNGPVSLKWTGVVTAFAVSEDGKKSQAVRAEYSRAKYGIVLKSAFSSKYDGGGNQALIDGVHGSPGFDDGRWQGFEGHDLEAIIDLGEKQYVHAVNVTFLSDWKSWILLPTRLEVLISEDGQSFRSMGFLDNTTEQKESGEFMERMSIPVNHNARYVQIFAKNVATCPDNHPGKGGKAWLFVDEISVE